MKTIKFILILVAFFIGNLLQAQIPGGLCNWDNNKKAAIVLTFDDWSPGHYPLVVPALNTRNLNATFFMTGSNVYNAAEWTKVATTAGFGNEIGNHTQTHPNLPSLTAAQLKTEIRNVKTAIDLNVTTQKTLSFAYPFGASNTQVIDSIRASGHIGARSVSPGIYTYNFAPTNTSYYNIATFSMDNTVTIGAYSTQIQNVLAGGGLLTFLYHSIDNAAGTYGDNWFNKILDTNLGLQLDQISAVKNTAWITTFSQALKYHKERNCATLAETQAPNGTTWKFNLTDTLANNSVFNQPLSIKLKMNGVNYTSITQNGISVAIDYKQNDSIMFHAVPDGGPIVLNAASTAITSLSVKDSTFNNGTNTIPVYVVDWIDNKSKPRKAVITKPYAPDNYPGICVLMNYFDGPTLKTIKSQTPNDPEPHNRGFGATVHHYSGGGWIDQNAPSFSVRFQGPHHAIFDLVQTIDGATETVTYTFEDGQDYFQWQETVQCSSVTSGTYDSRGPYSTVDWDGNGTFDAVNGQEYEAQNRFQQTTFNGPWTFGSAGKKGIPFVRQWKNSSEIGFVQSQTYTQQQAGVPGYSGVSLPASDANVSSGASYLWAFDFQMNFYDQLQKITWGMPYGYMEGQAGTGVKAGWGQYSLSIVMDALADNGVNRVRDENVLIHNGSVSVTASTGTVVTTGPVGTANPTMQTLSPAGYDHNYRTWWVQADATEQTILTMNVASGALKNPTFRIKAMTGLPAIVQYNAVTLTANTDYYASFNGSTGEVWLTLLKNVSGSNTLRIAKNGNVTISSATATPSTIINNGSAVVFDVTAIASLGSISSVVLDLSSIGGGVSVAMTSSGLNTWTKSFSPTAGFAAGTYTIPVVATDNLANTATATISVTVTTGTTISAASVTPNSVFNNVTNPLTFAVTATDDGSVSSVQLDLSSIGGSASFAMTSSGGNNYTSNFTMPAGISTGVKIIPIKVTDNNGNITTQTVSITVSSSTTYLDIYTEPSTMVTGTWAANAPSSVVEQTGAGAIEGTKDYLFSYTVASWWAGLGLNISNWTDAQAKDFSSYTGLELSYQGPSTPGTTLDLTLKGAGGATSIVKSLPLSASYSTVTIPLSFFAGFDLTKVTELDFAICGVASGSGTVRLDNIRLSKPAVVLPVSLLSFSAQAKGNTVHLTWTTINEINCANFSIEKSEDGIHYTTINTSSCLGKSNSPNVYSFTDVNFSKSSYYRLTELDENGSKTIYEAKYIIHASIESTLQLFPNPVQKGSMINIKSNYAGKISIQSMTGIELFTSEITENLPLQLSTKDWPSGIYIVKTSTESIQGITTEKLVIE